MMNKSLFPDHLAFYIFGALLQVLTIQTPASNGKLTTSTSKVYYTISNRVDDEVEPFNHKKQTSSPSKPFFWDSEEVNEIKNFDENDYTTPYMPGDPDIDEFFPGRSIVDRPKVYKYPLNSNENDANKWIMNAKKNGFYKNFDLREKWGKKCPSILEISDQGCCDSCWAVVASSVWSDRLCMHNNGINNTDRYSARALMTCCPVNNCKTFSKDNVCCSFGFQNNAWVYWTRNEIATGGFYGTGCLPYPKLPCYFNSTVVPSSKLSLSVCSDYFTIPDGCPTKCDNPKLKLAYSMLPRVKTSRIYYQLKRNNTATTANDEVGIKMEIFKHGPVHAIVKSNITEYIRDTIVNPQPEDSMVTAHSIRIVGWGEKAVRPRLNQSYWIVANSWGKEWGSKGFFKLAFNFTSYNDKDNVVYAGLYKYPETC